MEISCQINLSTEQALGKSFYLVSTNRDTRDCHVESQESRRGKEEESLLQEEREESCRSQEEIALSRRNLGMHLSSLTGSNRSTSLFSKGNTILDTKPCRLNGSRIRRISPSVTHSSMAKPFFFTDRAISRLSFSFNMKASSSKT